MGREREGVGTESGWEESEGVGIESGVGRERGGWNKVGGKRVG